jgi:hypothetical protein
MMKKTLLSATLLIMVIISSPGQEFTVKKGVIYCKSGIPQTPRWFADSRLAFAFEETGVTQVDYYNPLASFSGFLSGPQTIFLRNLWDGFRYYIIKENMNYTPVYENSKIWPFGVESEWNFNDLLFIHRVMAVDQSIVFQMITPEDLPAGYQFKLDFNTAFELSYSDIRDIRYPIAPGRKWKDWKFSESENLLVGGYYNAKDTPDRSEDDYTLCCAIGADFPMQYKVDRNVNVHQLSSPALEPGKTYCFIITFGGSESDAQKLNVELSSNHKERIKKQFSRYEFLRNSMPELIGPDQEINSYFSLMPMYNEALKITDCPGAMRAKTANYFIWGWDGMTANNSVAYWGDTAHIKNLLNFYKETADPVEGIGHCFAYNMKPVVISPIPAQCMYISLLQLYFDQTNDYEVLKEKYPFAKKIFDRAVATEVKSSGFSIGESLYPDFRDLIDETGNDISGFNNSVFYCSARSMNRLSTLLGDRETMEKSSEIINNLEANFLRYFYDKEKKFIVSSIDATTFEKRTVYLNGALRWENGYYMDLVEPILKDCLWFYEQYLISEAGIRPIPLWCKNWDADANQLHGWWPVTDETFTRMFNEYDRRDLADKWSGYLRYWYGKLMGPEGISCYIETDEPELDRWASLNGTWNAFTSRTWYQCIVHSIVGVDADAGGITFYPYSGEEIRLLGMHYLGKTFDIEMKGSGPFIEYIEVDGEKIVGTNKLPLEYYQNDKHIVVTVKRTADNLYPVSVKYGAGIVLKDYNYAQGVITTRLIGAGEVRLHVLSEKKPKIMAGHKQVKVEYDDQSKQGYIKLILDPKEELDVAIMK